MGKSNFNGKGNLVLRTSVRQVQVHTCQIWDTPNISLWRWLGTVNVQPNILKCTGGLTLPWKSCNTTKQYKQGRTEKKELLLTYRHRHIGIQSWNPDVKKTPMRKFCDYEPSFGRVDPVFFCRALMESISKSTYSKCPLKLSASRKNWILTRNGNLWLCYK
jgi:hypothetical protein